jgi:hypothetical protein
LHPVWHPPGVSPASPTAPRTYAEWLAYLDRFRGGDDTSLDEMTRGTIDWTNVVAERWTSQIADCLTSRLKALSTQLSTALARSGDVLAVSNALLAARRGLAPLAAFTRLPAIPPDVRQHLESELQRWASDAQKSLESSAAKERRDQGRLLKTLRDNPITRFDSVPASAPLSAQPAGRPGTRGRRIIL